VARHLEPFLAGIQTDDRHGPLPRFITKELRAFLDCGRLALGSAVCTATPPGRTTFPTINKDTQGGGKDGKTGLVGLASTARPDGPRRVTLWPDGAIDCALSRDDATFHEAPRLDDTDPATRCRLRVRPIAALR
jgi:hypothetical protein